MSLAQGIGQGAFRKETAGTHSSRGFADWKLQAGSWILNIRGRP